jgi:hypothetical protein
MTGFEYQAAAHMIWEGLDQPDLLQNGLAITRAIHDRYNAALRNPYNEIECSDHYSRAMASYGVFQAACGFNCHGPQGHVEFAPRLTPENFRATFTTAEGWGSFSQTRQADNQTCGIELKHGRLRLRSVALNVEGFEPTRADAAVADRPEAATIEREGNRIVVRFARDVVLEADQALKLELRA